jgi:hypothetical protein
VKAHICIGGPLDGEFASSRDFHGKWQYPEPREEGMYEHLARDYVEFHNASSSRKRAAVCWIHISLLPLPKAMRDR